MAPDGISLSEMTASFDTTDRTLRFYEQHGILAPKRIAGHRRYSSVDCLKLRLVYEGKRLGFTLAEIKARIDAMEVAAVLDKGGGSINFLTAGDNDVILGRIAALERKRSDIQWAIDELQRALRRFEADDTSP